MLTRVLACCLAACVLCCSVHAVARDYDTDMPAHAPELPIETIDGAAALVGRALPKGSDALFPVLKSVFRPWTIAENRVRPVQVKTMHETFDNEYEHVLIQGGKVAAVRLFVMNMDQIKQLTPELVHLYIKDFGEEILDDFEPSPKMKTPPIKSNARWRNRRQPCCLKTASAQNLMRL